VYTKYTDEKIITLFVNLLTTLFNGNCIDQFSDIVQIFEVQERYFNEDKTRTILLSYINTKQEVKVATFRIEKNDKKQWIKGNSMVFAAETAAVMSEMTRTAQVLFGAKTEGG
jgi:hypothetical protein